SDPPGFIYPSRIETQRDGKVLIAGGFESIYGERHESLARLNANGSLDGSFNFPLETLPAALCILVEPDQTILVGGSATWTYGPHAPLSRVNTDGSFNNNFAPADGIAGDL